MSWLNEKEKHQKFVTYFEEGCKLVEKKGWFWEFLAIVLFCGTFGKLKRKVFMENFATTLGPYIAIPTDREVSDFLLVHESIHVKHAKMLGLGSIWVGTFVYFILYTCLFPLGFNWFRFRFELDADSKAWMYMYASGEWDEDDVYFRASTFCDTVCSSSYGWPYPKLKGQKRFAEEAKKIIDDVKLWKKN